MRYLLENEQTQSLLQWAGSQRLTVADCFFWNGGSPDQASLTGLLRSILYETLQKNCKHYPDLTRLVFPEEWKKEKDLLLCSDTSMFRDRYGLPLKRLKKAFQTLRKQELVASVYL
jgi:hypothetical protein